MPEEQKISHSQAHAQMNKKKGQVQVKLIEQQKLESENLKATHTTGISPQQVLTAITQDMSCMYMGAKSQP